MLRERKAGTGWQRMRRRVCGWSWSEGVLWGCANESDGNREKKERKEKRAESVSRREARETERKTTNVGLREDAMIERRDNATRLEMATVAEQTKCYHRLRRVTSEDEENEDRCEWVVRGAHFGSQRTKKQTHTHTYRQRKPHLLLLSPSMVVGASCILPARSTDCSGPGCSSFSASVSRCACSVCPVSASLWSR